MYVRQYHVSIGKQRGLVLAPSPSEAAAKFASEGVYLLPEEDTYVTNVEVHCYREQIDYWFKVSVTAPTEPGMPFGTAAAVHVATRPCKTLQT